MTPDDLDQAGEEYNEPAETGSYQVKLDKISKLAHELHNKISGFEELPSWIQDKLTIAEHNLTAITDWVETQGHKDDLESPEQELDEDKKMKGDDPCWDGYEMVGHKKKDGKEVPNCVPKD